MFNFHQFQKRLVLSAGPSNNIQSTIEKVNQLGAFLQQMQTETNNKIQAYIQSQREKGVPDTEIEKDLINSIWSGSRTDSDVIPKGSPDLAHDIRQTFDTFEQGVRKDYLPSKTEMNKSVDPSVQKATGITLTKSQIDNATYALESLKNPSMIIDLALQFLNQEYRNIPTARTPNDFSGNSELKSKADSMVADYLNKTAREHIPKLMSSAPRIESLISVVNNANLSPEVVRAMMYAIRKRKISEIQGNVFNLYNKLVVQQKVISASEFNNLIQNSRTESNKVSPEDMKSLHSVLGSAVSSFNNTTLVGKVLKGTPVVTDKDGDFADVSGLGLEPVPSIINDEILLPLGLVWNDFNEQSPGDYVGAISLTAKKNRQEAMTAVENVNEAAEIAKQMGVDLKDAPEDVLQDFLKKYNWSKYIKALNDALEGSEHEAGAIHDILSSKNDAGLMAGNFHNNADRLILYIFNNCCGRNKETFYQLLKDAGHADLADEIDRTKGSYTNDEVFADYGLKSQSIAEQECLNKLRQNFGLFVVGYRANIPAPVGCPTNPKEFVLDFLASCDTLEPNGRASTDLKNPTVRIMHPVISSSVTFVGEYFGFDKKNVQPLKKTYTLPNGEVAEGDAEDGLDEKGRKKYKKVPMEKGTPVTIGSAYAVKSEWKMPMETFVSNMLGYHSIFITTGSKDGQIMSELDRNHILYKSRVGCTPNSCVASKQLAQHLQECTDPMCDSHKYTKYVDESAPDADIPKPRSAMLNAPPEAQKANEELLRFKTAEAYVQSAMVHFQTEHGLKPIIQQAYTNKSTKLSMGKNSSNVGPEIDSADIYRYFQEKTRISNELMDSWQNVQQSQNPATIKAYYEKYSEYKNLLNGHFAHMLEEHRNFTDSNEDYKFRLETFKNLLSAIKDKTTNPDPAIVKYQCNALVYEKDLARLQTDKAIISIGNKVTASQKSYNFKKSKE